MGIISHIKDHIVGYTLLSVFAWGVYSNFENKGAFDNEKKRNERFEKCRIFAVEKRNSFHTECAIDYAAKVYGSNSQEAYWRAYEECKLLSNSYYNEMVEYCRSRLF